MEPQKLDHVIVKDAEPGIYVVDDSAYQQGHELPHVVGRQARTPPER